MTIKIPLELVQKIIRERAQQDSIAITPQTKLAELDIDSFTLLEIVFDLEDALGTDIAFNAHDPQLEELATVGELLDYLEGTS